MNVNVNIHYLDYQNHLELSDFSTSGMLSIRISFAQTSQISTASSTSQKPHHNTTSHDEFPTLKPFPENSKSIQSWHPKKL